MDAIGSYKTRKIPRIRRTTIDLGRHGTRRHHVKGLLELDVTSARERIRAYRNETGRGLSLTAWIIKCVATAVSEYPQVQAYRVRESRLVIFEDVDVVLPVEKEIDGVKIPYACIIRETDKKDLDRIEAEVDEARREAARTDGALLGAERHERLERLYLYAPRFLRRLVWRRLRRDPFFAKKHMGTVLFTSLASFGKVDGWPVPFAAQPLCVALGSVVTKAGVVDGEIKPRELLKLTLLVDHDVVDGGEAARFVTRLAGLVEGAAGLEGAAAPAQA